METRRITLVATIVAIALLAVGIGYAYTAYSENANNTSNVAFITLTQTGENTPYTFADGETIQFHTFNETDSNTIYYALKTSVSLTGTGLTNAYTCSVLGSITLKADFVASASITAPTTINIDVADSDKFDSNGTWVFFLTNTDHNKIYAYKNTASTTTAWIDGPDALTVTNGGSATVEVLYGFDSTITPAKVFDGKKFYQNTRDMTTPIINGASLIFSAKDVGASGEITDPTSTTLDASALSAKTVTLKAGNGGSGTDIAIKFIGTYTLPKCPFTADSGKVFSKWQVGETQYDVGATVQITADTPITAVWTTQS